ncbi:MAG: hypothetical protein JSS86_15740 [Cyanobacteria bacterium SZAS LIN-2]|nr:hypothetical protein [Cyanobacteria bacterium SZAS LIN-2]
MSKRPAKFLTMLALAGAITVVFAPTGLSAKGTAAKSPAAAAPKQRIFSLSQAQQNSEILKVWGVPACVMMAGESPRGLYITGFTGDGLGSQMGLQVGDVILSLNGRVLLDAKQADNVLARMKSGKLKAVVARAANVAGGITIISPTIIYTADPNMQADIKVASASGGSNSMSGGQGLSEPSIGALEDYMFELVNQDRAANGNLPPLARSRTLGALARKYADDMKKRNFFGHDDPDGLNPTDRARRDGITSSVWENLAMESGNRNYRALVQRGENQMMDEPRDNPHNHRGCILSTHHHCVGIGVSVAATKVYCVQEFSPDSLP